MGVAKVFRRHPAAMALAAGAALVAAGMAVGSALIDDDEIGHAVGHLLPAVAVGGVLVSARWWRPPAPGRLGSGSRRAVIAFAGLIAAGLAAEAIGAFGYDGYARVNSLAGIHDAAMFTGPVGLLGLLVSALASLSARISAGRTPTRPLTRTPSRT